MLTRTQPHPHHPVLIGAPRDMLAQRCPLILQRSDEDFIESTLADLRSAAGRAQLQSLRARTVDAKGQLKLFQPIQRQFHLALIEAWCDAPGAPRIAPARVHSAGLLLRRLDAGGRPEGWMKSQGRLRGWQSLARLGGAGRDPDAALRLERRATGVAAIDRQLAASAAASADEALEEQVIPLYLAPPDVNADAGKTLFYGLVPTVSGDLSEAAPSLGDDADQRFGPDTAAFTQHLVEALRGEGQSLPFAGQALRSGWFDASEMPADLPPPDITTAQWNALKDPGSSDARAMQRLLLLLRQLSGEFNAFDGGKEVAALQALLRAIRLPLVLQDGEKVARTVVAFDFLRDATDLLLAKESLPRTVEMPSVFPALDAATRQRLKTALHAAMSARFSAMKGRAGRFDEPGARYVLRAFVRLKSECGQAPRTVWSEDSEPFGIAAWYEGAGAPPVQIPLPDASDRSLLKQLKPNVAFVVPPSMQNLLSGKTKDLMEGKGSVGTAGLSWICGFNIPIITICAFIVLNIFLTLFNLIFGWLFFIKICIPFPKIGNKPPGG
ncbi:MAG: hypothetical protein JNL87_09830 [Burkholderiaceae bacterium]|nr:hypothetical protein [Burkholderiaceae bacterium]